MNHELTSPADATTHLEPEVWAVVNRALAAKAIGELAHELVIEPVLLERQRDDAWAHYALRPGIGGIEYRFRARTMSLDHWHVDAASIQKLADGRELPVDAMRLIVDLGKELAIRPEVLPGYLQEVAITLYGAAFKRAGKAPGAEALAGAAFQKIEASMTEGHPIFIANNGRVGFSATDYRRYAPEAASPVTLVWLAVRKERADLACVRDTPYERLLEEELGAAVLDGFARELRGRGLDPGGFVYMPAHPWQWNNRLAQLFGPDLAAGDLVYLGESEDRYLAQQSIRTFFNVTAPHKRYVKTALSIINMGFDRGMSAALAPQAMAVNDWVGDLVGADPTFARLGFRLLREVAFIGLRHRHYDQVVKKRVDLYKDLLAALWRESPVPRLGPGQRLMTMAALMHVDAAGGALMPALIRLSGLDAGEWVRRYLHCYLTPLLHAFYAHNLVFSPHCENIILVLEDHAPVGVFLKDLGQDIGVLNPEAPLPEAVRHLALRVPEEVMTLSIFTDAFDCVFRFLAPILELQAGYPEASFWRAVATCVHDYAASQPQLAAKLRRYDLFAPTFIRNCLNRLQLVNNEMMVDLNAPEPVDSLQFAGTLTNPIAAYALDRGGRHAAV